VIGHDSDPTGDEPPSADADELEVVEIAITDVLDLHSFRPQDVLDVVRDYLDAATEEGLTELRIIHGRGIGMQRKAVQKLLEQDERVIHYADAPQEAGGWGTTLVRLSRDSSH